MIQNLKRIDMEIIVPNDCGNAPRKNFLKDYHIAMAKADLPFFEQHVADSICWEIVGARFVETKDNYLDAVQQYAFWNVGKMVIEAIITHGTDAAVYGTFTAADGGEFAFCDNYKFKGFKGFEVKSIKSFLINLSK